MKEAIGNEWKREDLYTNGHMGQHVAIAHDWLLRHRGGERVLQEFCRRFQSVSIYTLFLDARAVHPLIKQHAIHVSPLGRLPGVNRYYRYLLPWFGSGIERFHVRDADLLLSISHAVAKGIPHDSRIPHVCYCLTPMRYLWEERLYFPNQRLDFQQRLLALFSRKLRQWDLESNRGVDFLVAVSHTVKERIKRTYGREAQVIYPCVDLESFHPLTAVRGERIEGYLVVSSLVPYKRIELAIEAFNRSGKPLLIAGEGPLRRRLMRRARPNIRFLGRVTDQELCRLYNTARGLIFPGVEDLGLVPLEAQACGCAVIAYGQGGATETVIDGETGLFFREASVEALLKAIDLFEKTSFDEKRAVGNAGRFSSQRFCSEWRMFFHQAGLNLKF